MALSFGNGMMRPFEGCLNDLAEPRTLSKGASDEERDDDLGHSLVSTCDPHQRRLTSGFSGLRRSASCPLERDF
jgi:hypothetical protein